MQPDAMARLLPAVYQEALRNDAGEGDSRSELRVLLELIAAMHESTEAFLADPARAVDPYRVPADRLAAIARWVGLGPYLDQSSVLHSDDGSLRELTRRAASLARRRGTAKALLEMCELVTGTAGFAIEESPPDEQGRSSAFHFRLVAPAAARPKRAVIESLIAREKPCFVTAEIVFAAPVRDAEPHPTTESEHA